MFPAADVFKIDDACQVSQGVYNSREVRAR
jgi:hypothetical protein